ncbi:hypothetical protein MMC07_000090 [Pseudocyphellaria aurata]|nr:hypothetical protein [Pseudocyphellaria aurata]
MLETVDEKAEQTPLYTPNDDPGPTRFAVAEHRLTKEVCSELDNFFLEHWPWPNEKAKARFAVSETVRWACLALPLVADDRIFDLAKINTVLFLLDDIAETMDLAGGKEFYMRLVYLAYGKALPNRENPVEWITYDCCASLRERDEVLAKDIFDMIQRCFRAQVDKARLKCASLGDLLKQRIQEGGCPFIASLIRYGHGLHLSPEALQSVSELETSVSMWSIVVNDICSYDKEVQAQEANPTEGGLVLNVVDHLTKNTNLTPPAAKRAAWAMTREGELRHQELLAARLKVTDPPCTGDLMTFVEGLDYATGGNEVWSRTTGRYHEKNLKLML